MPVRIFVILDSVLKKGTDNHKDNLSQYLFQLKSHITVVHMVDNKVNILKETMGTLHKVVIIEQP